MHAFKKSVAVLLLVVAGGVLGGGGAEYKMRELKQPSLGALVGIRKSKIQI